MPRRAVSPRRRSASGRQRARAAARQELLGIVTHELKTPVAVLRAYTELLLGRAEAAGRTEDAELLRRMEDQADRMLAMVDQVLDLQRLDAGLFPLEIGRVELGALVQRVLEGLQLTARDVTLRLELGEQGKRGEAGEPVWVRADRRRIEQVVINVVQNAIRFSPAGGEVVVRVGFRRDAPARIAQRSGDPAAVRANRSPDRWAEVSVSDSGPGVAAIDRDRIFGRFYQGQGGEKLYRGHGGLGLGLYIAREIVQRHGGELRLDATPAGRGATFCFTLPASGPDQGD